MGKRKTAKRALAFFCTALMLAGIAACDGNGGNSAGSGNTGNEGYSVWSTYNTMKVMQDSSLNGNYEQKAAKITAKMAKNELESAQIFVTAGSKAISSFELVAADLWNEEGDVFPASQVDIYAQKYIEITQKTINNYLEEYPLGWTPDAIVPMEAYKEFGENKIEANCNQGITVDFLTTEDTPAGTYTGSFTLLLDSETVRIPVSLTVWDFALPEKSAAESCVLIYENAIVYGEMTTQDLDVWYKSYYDILLRYKMNGFTVPYSYDSPEKMVESVLEYWDHPNFASYGMPHHSFTGDGYLEYWYNCLYLLATNSTEDKVLYDRGYFYVIDEPATKEAYAETVAWMDRIEELKATVAEDLVADGVFEGKTEEYKQRVLKSLDDMQFVCTVANVEELDGTDITYCPTIERYTEYGVETGIEESAEAHNNQMWYYTCLGPQYPYSTQHIDDYLITGRIMKWIQKDYDLTGWLYWSANHSYITIPFTQIVININPYEEAMRCTGGVNISNGDGYLLYPGSRYDLTEPVSSLRLLAYREGQDDLDMLNYLETLYKEYEAYYGVEEGTFDVNEVLKGLYDQIFCRSYCYTDSAIFDAVRDAVAQKVENALYSRNKFIYTVDYSGKYADYTFYTANGYDLKAGGETLTGTVSGNGKKYTLRVDLSKETTLSSIELTDGNSTETVMLNEATPMRGVDVLSDDFTLTTSTGSECTKTEDALVLDIRSQEGTTAAATMRFIPYVSLAVEEDFDVIVFDLENMKEEKVSMKLIFVAEDGSTYEQDITLTGSRKQTVEGLNYFSVYKDKKVTEVRIEFLNYYSEDGVVKLYEDRQLELSGIRFQ